MKHIKTKLINIYIVQIYSNIEYKIKIQENKICLHNTKQNTITKKIYI